MTISAYLRVYVPASGADGPVLPHVEEHAGIPRVLRAGEYGLSAESARDDAFVIDRDGTRYVCPRNPRLRMLEGLLAFRHAYGDSLTSALVPEEVADRAADELDRIHDRFPGVKSHILTSPFAVPLRWFSVFDPDERIVADADGSMTVRYRTELAEGLRRLRRAAQIIEAAGFDDMVIEQVGDLVRWLDEFPRDAIVELDYGGVTALFDDADLVLDESAVEVGQSLDCLAVGDFERAGAFYAAVARRWAPVQAVLYAN